MPNQLATQQEPETRQELMLNPDNPREREMMLGEREFSMLQRKANALSASNIIPKEYQGNIPNCMIAMEMANRLHTGELEIMQNLHVIHGKPGFSSAYLIARINNSGILKGRLRFEMVGTAGQDDYGCYAYGTDKETGEVLKGTVITVDMAKKQGWWGKNGSKWPDMTDQMLSYRAASFWSRIYAPDATMGMHTVEEAVEIVEKEINPIGADVSLSSVQDMLDKKPAPALETVDTDTGEITESAEEAAVEIAKPEEKRKVVKNPGNTIANNRLNSLIEMAGNQNDLDAIVAMDDWEELAEGEAVNLQATVQNKRDEFTHPA